MEKAGFDVGCYVSIDRLCERHAAAYYEALICVHVNHGLMRKGESEQVIDVFKNQMDASLVYADATDRFLGKLADVAEPEAKRKIIDAEFIRVLLVTGTHWMPPQVDVGSILATRSWIRVSVLEPQGPRKRQT